MKVECSKCKRAFEAEGQIGGLKTVCPTCQTDFALAGLAVPPPLPASLAAAVTTPSVELKPENKSSSQLNKNRVAIIWAAALVVICVVMGATVIVALWILRPTPTPQQAFVTQTEPKKVELNIGAMQAVLRRDKELGAETKALIAQITPTTNEDLDRPATLMRNQVTECKRIDTSSCPRDFAEAYYRHLAAWSAFADVYASHPRVPVGSEAMIEGFFRGLAGDPTGGAFERQAEFKAWWKRLGNSNENVESTWREVEALAIRYGAK